MKRGPDVRSPFLCFVSVIKPPPFDFIIGRTKVKVNAFAKKERCENCKYWEILPVEEQPPCGWGVRGQCNCVHEPERMQQGYWKVDSTSYCQDFAPKW